MIRLNSEHIIVGYIKNLLAEFNLPTPKVYKDSLYCVKDQIYLKDDSICRCIKSGKNEEADFVELFYFDEDFQKTNYYTNLKFTDLNYDSYTHEYLGKYLRFLKDYKKIDLMSLYNCFSDRFAEDLLIIDNNTSNDILVNGKDTSYKYYMIPVRLDENYTIAIDSDRPYEIFATLYGRSQYSSEEFSTPIMKLYKQTKVKVTSSNFNSPILYDKLNNISDSDTTIYTNATIYEKDLKLIIKLPANNASSIVVLEGNYSKNNDFGFLNQSSVKWYESGDEDNYIDPFKITYNSSVVNFNAKKEQEKIGNTYSPENINLISNLQLLKINSGVSYPFADRLIEYLTNNAISNLDNISDNIKRVQWALYEEKVNNPKSVWGKGDLASNYGIWSDDLKLYIYNLAKSKNLLNDTSDILSYVDKDIEINLGEYIDIYEKEDA